jgi:hypothetical protein
MKNTVNSTGNASLTLRATLSTLAVVNMLRGQTLYAVDSNAKSGAATGQAKESLFGRTRTVEAESGLKPPYLSDIDEDTMELIVRVPMELNPQLQTWTLTEKQLAKHKKDVAEALNKKVGEVTVRDLQDAGKPDHVGQIVKGHRRMLCQSIGSQYAGAPLLYKNGEIATYKGRPIQTIQSYFQTEPRAAGQTDETE